MSHAHPRNGRSFERGGDKKKRTNGEHWLWRLVGLFLRKRHSSKQRECSILVAEKNKNCHAEVTCRHKGSNFSVRHILDSDLCRRREYLFLFFRRGFRLKHEHAKMVIVVFSRNERWR